MNRPAEGVRHLVVSGQPLINDGVLDVDVVPQHEEVDGHVPELYRSGYVRLAAGTGRGNVDD